MFKVEKGLWLTILIKEGQIILTTGPAKLL